MRRRSPQTGRTVPAAELTGSVGGSVNWVGMYDAGVNRLSFFDPLDDLATVAPGGTEANQASYLVAGWWSTATLDPLDGAQTSTSLHHRLQSLKWALADDAEGGDRLHIGGTVQRLRQESIGLEASTRYSSTAPKLGVLGRAAATEAHIQDAISTQVVQPVRSIFVDDSRDRRADRARLAAIGVPAWLVHGVPTSGPPPLDNRPKASDVGVALGEQGDDIAAALASTELGAADEASRRALERLLSAFTGHLLDRVGSADGLVDVEENEHAASFVARHGGAGVIDRLQSGRQLGGFAAGRQARGDAARAGLGSGGGKRATSAAGPGAKVTSFSKTRSELTVMSVVDQRSTVSEWAGKRPDVEPAVEAREVVRPAPRLYLPAEPILAVRGAKRSLRHGGDGHFSQDGLLHCRWPSQVVDERDAASSTAPISFPRCNQAPCRPRPCSSHARP